MYYLDNEFERRCDFFGISIEDSQYYCNEGTKYEIKDLTSLMNAIDEYIGAALNDPDGANFKVTITCSPHGCFLFSHYPDDD